MIGTRLPLSLHPILAADARGGDARIGRLLAVATIGGAHVLQLA